MTYFFQICHIRIRCDLPFAVVRAPEAEPFLTEAQTPDMQIEFHPVSTLTLPKGSFVQRGLCRFYTDSTGGTLCHLRGQPLQPVATVKWQWSQPDRLICNYLQQEIQWISTTKGILDAIGLETVMLLRGALLLHASLICVQGRGIVFTAPSGTGKSTQAGLWEHHRQAQILNGDRAGLRKTDGRWYAYGLPYAGTSGVYRAEEAPLCAIILLSQAKENQVTPATAAEALRFMYPELTVHRWDPEYVDRALALFSQLCADIPIYRLECTPDEQAVQTLENTLFPTPDK